MKKNKRKLLTFLLSVLGVVGVIFLIYVWQENIAGGNGKPFIICPTDSISVSVESLADNSILLRDVTAMDVEDGDITGSVVVESVSQFVDEGHSIVTYAAFDSTNNVSKLTRHLFLTDYHPPRFTISAPLEFSYSSNFNPLSCVGAFDCIDGDISDRVKMILVNPDDDITSVGTHQVEFRVTNSLGDVSSLETEIEVYDRTYTEARMIPNLRLSEHLVYVDRYCRIDPASFITGVTLNGAPLSVEEYSAGSIEIDDSRVDYSTPGVYKIFYTCDNRGEYYGYTVLIVIVTEVAR